MASTPTQDDFLASTRKGQEAMVVAIKTWLETVRTANHKLTSVYAPVTDRLPKLPRVRLPFADRLPTPEDAVASAYDLAEQLLASQRRFAEDLVRATAPLMSRWGVARLEGNDSSEPRIPARKAWEEAVAVSEEKPVAVSEPKPVAVSEPKPVAVSEPKPVAVSPKKSGTPKSGTTARGTGSPRTSASTKSANTKSASTKSASTKSASTKSASTKSASTKSASTKSAAKRDGASPEPKDAAAS